MTTKSELLKARGKYFRESKELSTLQFDKKVSLKRSFEIKKQQDDAYKKYQFILGLNKAYDKSKEEKQEETDFEDCFVCQNCREMYPIEDMGTSELARQDQICKYCMEERGYGR